MNELKIFENKDFGKIRMVLINNEPYFVGKDVAEILGYSNTSKALIDHVDDEDKLNNESLLSLGQRGGWIINESGLYSLILSSKLPTAKKFKRWVIAEVIPTIRKTGTYNVNPALKEDVQLTRAKAMELNARTRAAQTWLKIAALVNVPEYKQIASTYAANTLANKEVLELPQAERKTYSATEIGNMFGVSANKIGKLANENNLKKPEYGKLFYDKSRYSCKEVETWRYYDTAIPVFAKLLSKEVA